VIAMLRILRAALCLLLFGSASTRLAAQESIVQQKEFHLGFNILLGGAYAAAGAVMRDGGDPLAAFVRGAAGGAVTWGGQRIIAGGRPAFRLPGVQLAALGTNIMRNAARGVPLISDVTLPVYPAYVRIRHHADRPISIRISAAALAGVAWTSFNAARMQATLDWRESLMTGAPVFRSRASHIYPATIPPSPQCYHGDACSDAAAGLHWLGTTTFTTGGRSQQSSREILNHEIIHLTQVHRDALLFALPASDALLERLGGPLSSAASILVLDAFLPLAAINQALAVSLPRTHGEQWRFFEFEARAHAGPRQY
jgi:hypothetical protein